VAVFVVSRWEGALDTAKAKKVLGGEIPFVSEEDRDRPVESPELTKPQDAKSAAETVG
jgi:aerobic C4-dicarboxylate transport protein